MTTKGMASSVGTIEVEAEKLLEQARSRANEILRKASEEASEILSAKMSLDEVEAERQQIIHKATEEANKELKDAKKKAAEIKTDTGKKVDKIAKHIVDIITGAKLG